MALRLKNISSVQKLFGNTGGFGAFANNEVIKNNPQLLSILASKNSRISFKKKSFGRSSAFSKAWVKSINQEKKTLTRQENNSQNRNIIAEKHNETEKKSSQEINQQHAREKEQARSAVDNTSKAELNVSSTNTKVLLDKRGFKKLKWSSKEKHRYYNVHLQPTLLGNYSITKSWGSLCGNLGNYKTIFCNTLEEAAIEIEKIAKQRKYKGYREILEDKFSFR